MEIQSLPLGVFISAYNFFRDKKLDAALERLGAAGVTVDDLKESDYRFAAFMRFVNALETCSSNKMLDTFVEYIVAGVKTKKIDERPDIYQIVLSNLGG